MVRYGQYNIGENDKGFHGYNDVYMLAMSLQELHHLAAT